MGDGADDLIDAGIEQMSDRDFWWEPGNSPQRRTLKNLVRCKYCKLNWLEWKHTAAGWRLFDGGSPHSCEEYKASRERERATG